MKSVWPVLPPGREEKQYGKHPAQKPVALLDRIIRASSNEGDLVLDPFMGSGTTLVAATRCCRPAFGIELDTEFISTTLSRVTDELIFVSMMAVCAEIDLDPEARSMDRSRCSGTRATDALSAGKLVRRERSFYFIGTFRREVVYSVVAGDLEEAMQKFSTSTQSGVEILLVVKTETEIYLTQTK
jgi:hypothetical protein